MPNPFRNAPFFYVDTNNSLLARRAYKSLPPSNDYVLNRKWFWKSPENFLKNYPEVGTIYWSRSHNYHLLIVSGHKVLCMWTVHTNKMRMEVNEVLHSQLCNKLDVPTSFKAFKGFYSQFQLTKPEEVDIVIQEVKKIYGV